MKKAERKPKKTVSFERYQKYKSRFDLTIEGDPPDSFVSKEDDPSPLEFETFIPWVCRQWQASTSVVITPKLQEGDLTSKKSKHKMRATSHLDKSNISVSISVNKSMEGINLERINLVPVTAYYDSQQRLVEIAIEGSAISAPRTVITAIGLCVPYHSSVTRFTYRRSPLTAALIYEINKLLPISNISEIVFDDSYVPEANYYILLEQISQLIYLSLNRCKINDAICKKIFENIKPDAPAANSLQILQLGSNDITDDAAIFIASVLRANRSLLHLNLSGNKITDSGFVPILDSLMEFPLNIEEKNDMRRRKLKYLQSKAAVYERCLNNLKCRYTDDFGSSSSGPSPVLKLGRSKTEVSIRNLEEEAEIMTDRIIGGFHDPFSPDAVVVKNKASYSKGNFVLCYINITYNNLSALSVRRLYDVLRYQDDMGVSQSQKGITGLIKITLDGNFIPTTCSSLLQEIDFYLKKVILSRTTGRKVLPRRLKKKISSYKS